jgi:undecaprenyl-diphosphatase
MAISRHFPRNLSRNVWGYIEGRDHRVMRRLNRWRAPRWIRYWMIAATRMGDGWLWYGLAGMLLLYGGAPRYAAVGSASAAALAGVLVFKSIKLISQRPRPCQLEPHCWSKVLPPDRFSFPSGHTMTAFSVALVVSYFYPSLEAPLFFLAISIAVSRIVLGMHFLSDVLAGVVLGVALGCASITAFAAMGFI